METEALEKGLSLTTEQELETMAPVPNSVGQNHWGNLPPFKLEINHPFAPVYDESCLAKQLSGLQFAIKQILIGASCMRKQLTCMYRRLRRDGQNIVDKPHPSKIPHKIKETLPIPFMTLMKRKWKLYTMIISFHSNTPTNPIEKPRCAKKKQLVDYCSLTKEFIPFILLDIWYFPKYNHLRSIRDRNLQFADVGFTHTDTRYSSELFDREKERALQAPTARAPVYRLDTPLHKKTRTKETELVRYLGIKSVRLQEAL
ncbi:hypothetical protein NQ318_014719 [Aromia moschata]|uniref:Uncharacterized protein n=1 Tax=Aromia moschata TaxID=1265417 RepID=A0AAV8ZE65_9CUCU|nr:hypothetical protein NQ318_014719 [Aromia moschata]